MKKFVIILSLYLSFVSSPSTYGQDNIVLITAPMNQMFTGEFRNDDLAQSLAPTGKLGLLVFQPAIKNRTWIIDAALIDEVIAMSGNYVLANKEKPTGSTVAKNWIIQLQSVSASNKVIALAYGNPDTNLAKNLAPSELRKYISFGKERLQIILGRDVESDFSGQSKTGRTKLDYSTRNSYSENRQALTRLNRVVNSPEVSELRLLLAKLLSPDLDKKSRAFFTKNADDAVKLTVNKLRINSGRYQITTSEVRLPVTVINDFQVEVRVDLLILPNNSRVTVESFDNVTVPAESKRQLEMPVYVNAPGTTEVSVSITNDDGVEIVPKALLLLNSTVIDTRVIWLTVGSAVLLLLAGVFQSVRRVRRRVH